MESSRHNRSPSSSQEEETSIQLPVSPLHSPSFRSSPPFFREQDLKTICEGSYRRVSDNAMVWKAKESDLVVQLKEAGNILECKENALSAIEMELKKEKELRTVMEGAIQNLKSQLSCQEQAYSAGQIEMELIYKDLHKSNEEKALSAQRLQAQEYKLQNLKHTTGDQAKMFQSRITDLEQELERVYSQVTISEEKLHLLTSDSVDNKKKKEALTKVLALKDKSLKEMEEQIVLLQAGLEDKCRVIEDQESNLNILRKRDLQQLQNQRALECCLASAKGSLAEKDKSESDLVMELENLANKVNALEMQIAHKNQELDGLHNTLKEQVHKSHVEDCSKVLNARLTEEKEHICNDLHKSNEEKALLIQRLQAQECKIQNLEHTTGDQAKRSQSRITDLEQELERVYSQVTISEEKLHLLTSNSVENKKKNEALTKILALKDKGFKEMEEQVVLLQAGLEEKCRVIEDQESDLTMLRKKEFQQLENQRALEGCLASAKGSLAEKDKNESDLLMELERLANKVNTLEMDIAHKNRELEGFNNTLKGQVHKSDVEDCSEILIARLIEEKENVISSMAMEAKRDRELREMMEAAIDNLKLQLSSQQQIYSAQQIEMKHVYEELEKSKTEQTLLSNNLGSLECKLQNLEEMARTDLDLEREKRRENHILLETLKSDLSEWREKALYAEKLVASQQVAVLDLSNTIDRLRLQLKIQKDREVSLETSNRNLKNEFSVVQERGIARRKKLLQVLVQLENTQFDSSMLQEQIFMLQKKVSRGSSEILLNDSCEKDTEHSKLDADRTSSGSAFVIETGDMRDSWRTSLKDNGSRTIRPNKPLTCYFDANDENNTLEHAMSKKLSSLKFSRLADPAKTSNSKAAVGDRLPLQVLQ